MTQSPTIDRINMSVETESRMYDVFQWHMKLIVPTADQAVIKS